MALTLTSMVISGLNVITASILIMFIVSKKTYQLESTCVLSWVVINKLDLLLTFTIFSFGLKFIWLLLVMPKGVEGKKGKDKAPCGRGHGSTRDEDDGSPGGGPGHGWGCGHHVIPGDRSPAKPWKMGSATKGKPQQEWTVQRMQGALDLYKSR